MQYAIRVLNDANPFKFFAFKQCPETRINFISVKQLQLNVFKHFYLIRLNDITYKLGTKCTQSTVINLFQSNSLYNCLLRMYDSFLFQLFQFHCFKVSSKFLQKFVKNGKS